MSHSRSRHAGCFAAAGALLLTVSSLAAPPTRISALPTISWDAASVRLLHKGGDYPRMVRLADGSIVCAFDSQRKMWLIRSHDEAEHWDEPLRVAEEAESWLTNAELLVLHDGTLLYFWNDRPLAALRAQHAQTQPATLTRPFRIRMVRSNDGGHMFSAPQTLYSAGTTFDNGCWEPAGIQLPSGEIQVYFANEGPFTNSADQEISLVRSKDGGRTWSKAEPIAYRKHHRDGMPAPLLLADKRGIVIAIEDNGYAGERFKPVIVRTDLTDNWHSGARRGDSRERYGALAEPLNPAWYAGAPGLRQLPSGYTLLSYQEGSDGDMARCRMAVCIGDREAHNFTNKTYPFAPPTEGYQAWNSLFVKDARTVIALSSATINGVRGIWAVNGRIIDVE